MKIKGKLKKPKNMEKLHLLKKRGSDQPIAHSPQKSFAKKSSSHFKLNSDQLLQSSSGVTQQQFLQSSPIPVPVPKFNVHYGNPAMSSQEYMQYQYARHDSKGQKQTRRRSEENEKSHDGIQESSNVNFYRREEHSGYDLQETKEHKFQEEQKDLQNYHEQEKTQFKRQEEAEQSLQQDKPQTSSFGREQPKTTDKPQQQDISSKRFQEQKVQRPLQDMELSDTEMVQASSSGLQKSKTDQSEEKQKGQSSRSQYQYQYRIFKPRPGLKDLTIEKNPELPEDIWVSDSENDQPSQLEEQTSDLEKEPSELEEQPSELEEQTSDLEKEPSELEEQSSEAEEQKSVNDDIEELNELQKWLRSRKQFPLQTLSNKMKPTSQVLPLQNNRESRQDDCISPDRSLNFRILNQSPIRNSQRVSLHQQQREHQHQENRSPPNTRSNQSSHRPNHQQILLQREEFEPEEGIHHNREEKLTLNAWTQTVLEDFPDPPLTAATDCQQLLQKISELQATLRVNADLIRRMRDSGVTLPPEQVIPNSAIAPLPRITIEQRQQSNNNIASTSNQARNSELVYGVEFDDGRQRLVRSSAETSNAQASVQRISSEVELGRNGTKIPLNEYQNIFWESTSTATKQLLTLLFDQEVLANFSCEEISSLMEVNGSNEGKLDPKVLEDIISAVSSNCNATKEEIHSAIVETCLEEYKSLHLPDLEILFLSNSDGGYETPD